MIDFAPEEYPILFEFLHPDTGEVVHTIRVERPAKGTKAKIYIPPLSRMLGHPVGTRTTFGDGRVITIPAPSASDTGPAIESTVQ